MISATEEAIAPRAEYCHGAGANGDQYRLLAATPHAIYLERRGHTKNPHVYRVAAEQAA